MIKPRKWYESAVNLAMLGALALGLAEWPGITGERGFQIFAFGAIGGLAAGIDQLRRDVDNLRRRLDKLIGVSSLED